MASSLSRRCTSTVMVVRCHRRIAPSGAGVQGAAVESKPHTHTVGSRLASVILYKPRAGGYSIEKFLALHQYMETSSVCRVAFVMFVTPLPGLLGAILPSFIPLQDPTRGLKENPGYCVSGFLMCCIVHFGTLLHSRAGAELPSNLYNSKEVLAATLITAFVQHAISLSIIYVWRFPMPMSWIVASAYSSPCMVIGHLVVFRKRCWQDKELVEGIKRYLPALQFQCIQIILYPAFSVLFDHASNSSQVVLTLLYPLIKYIMKKGLRRYTHKLKDFSTEVAVTGIEICASLYQSMILQSSPSQAALAVIMSVDILQGIAAVKFFMDRPSTIARHLIVQEALKELRASHPPPETLSVNHYEWDIVLLGEGTGRELAKPVVLQALQLVSVAESILLVEYVEVVVPLINSAFVAISCKFSSAQYNPRLRNLFFDDAALAKAVQSIMLYSFLQALSFVAMHVVMRYRYGLSATYQLAFILERHWLSIVGKMIGWLPIILHFTVVHFGVDFSFRFDFEALLNGTITH